MSALQGTLQVRVVPALCSQRCPCPSTALGRAANASSHGHLLLQHTILPDVKHTLTPPALLRPTAPGACLKYVGSEQLSWVRPLRC